MFINTSAVPYWRHSLKQRKQLLYTPCARSTRRKIEASVPSPVHTRAKRKGAFSRLAQRVHAPAPRISRSLAVRLARRHELVASCSLPVVGAPRPAIDCLGADLSARKRRAIGWSPLAHPLFLRPAVLIPCIRHRRRKTQLRS